MFGSTILDVAIGLVFIFLLSSLIASAIREGIEAWTKTRASQLEAGLREILRDQDGKHLVQQFYNHPLVSSLYQGSYDPGKKRKLNNLLKGSNLPSYIPSRNFALALMDMAARGPQVDSSQATIQITLDSIRKNIGTIDNPFVQRAILVALDRANGEIRTAQLNLEAWYDSAMDRVSGWYKRITQWILIAIGIALAVALNINSLQIGTTLFHDKTSRDLLVDSATKFAQDRKDTSNLPGYDEALSRLDSLNLPIGWTGTICVPSQIGSRPDTNQAQQVAAAACKGDAVPSYLISRWTPGVWSSNIGGWLITAFAISMGAPFWFDWLNRLIVIRSTVKPHQKSPEEPSQDSAADAPEAAVGAAISTAGAAPPQAPALEIASAPQPPPLAVAQALPAGLEPDGCGVAVQPGDITTDEELPFAEGGVE